MAEHACPRNNQRNAPDTEASRDGFSELGKSAERPIPVLDFAERTVFGGVESLPAGLNGRIDSDEPLTRQEKGAFIAGPLNEIAKELNDHADHLSTAYAGYLRDKLQNGGAAEVFGNEREGRDITAEESTLNHLKMAVKLATSEILTNALAHGNECDPRKEVVVHCSVDRDNNLIVHVCDQSEVEFKRESVPDPRADEALSIPAGRGCLLADAYCSIPVRYHFEEGKGNTAILKFSPRDKYNELIERAQDD